MTQEVRHKPREREGFCEKCLIFVWSDDPQHYSHVVNFAVIPCPHGLQYDLCTEHGKVYSRTASETDHD